MYKAFVLGLLAAFPVTTVMAKPVIKADRARTFDGKWSIEVITERGACDRAYRYGMRIENSQARYDGSSDFTVSGRVNVNGAVKGSIARGESRADVVGALSGGFGTGTWTTSGSASCGGRWNAERRS